MNFVLIGIVGYILLQLLLGFLVSRRIRLRRDVREAEAGRPA